MTYCGPYSTATLMYTSSDDDSKLLGVVATPNTILDVVANRFPWFLPIIETAQLTRLYNATEEESIRIGALTLFVPGYVPHQRKQQQRAYNLEEARLICQASTVRGRINLATLKSSPCTIMHTINSFHDIIVKSYTDSYTFLNDSKVEEIEISCSNGLIIPIEHPCWRFF